MIADDAGTTTRRPQLTLLGGFSLRIGAEAVPIAPHVQRLVALLALNGTALPRRYVGGVLWGDVNEAHAHGSLRSALWKLNVAGLEIVEHLGDSLQLSRRVDVDVRRVTGLAGALLAGRPSEDATDLLEPGLLLDLLPGWYEDWVLAERERLRQLSLHALELLCEQMSEAARFGAAVLAGLAAVSREPLRESAYRALVKAYLAEGNVGEAMRSYEQYVAIAARELGVEPSASLRSLVEGMPHRVAGARLRRVPAASAR